MRQRRAFTLIELLVVIAIIALLLSILLPGLKKAKERVKDVICRTRTRGIGMAILLYLQDNDYRAFNSDGTNGYLWYDSNGQFLDTTDNDAAWGVAYRHYTEDHKVFRCPSFNPSDVSEVLYTAADFETVGGYGLNTFFYLDRDSGDYNRKTANVKTPSRFIITHDHVEPRFESYAHDYEGNDSLYIPPGQTHNLDHYRYGSRNDYYRFIFRHNKKNMGDDNPASQNARIPVINNNPNGNLNMLFLDGSVDKVRETTGENIPYTMYSGTKNYL